MKDNIDTAQTRDPAEKLKEKVKNKNHHFTLKTVTKEQVKRMMAEMKKKKSSGLDGIGQDLLLMGTDMIRTPLTRVTNNSTENDTFPTELKKAIVTQPHS